MGGRMTCVMNMPPPLPPPSERSTVEQDGTIYHEKQSRELCALHALNNLFQERMFTKRDLDGICYKLSPDAYVNPHKSMFGLGNYDVNVIMAALQAKNFDTIWFDKRKEIVGLALENVYGFILNIPMDYKWGILHLPLRRKHWIVIRRIGRNYYNLDSKLDGPLPIGNPVDLVRYLQEQMECKDKELLLIVSQRVSTNGSWWRLGKSSSEQHDKSGKTPAPSKDLKPGEKNNQSEKKKNSSSAPLAESEDDKSRELELTIDCRIVSGEVEKPKYLKKYHQDYVPIEIHRTTTKKDVHSLDGKSEVDSAKENAPADVETVDGNSMELSKNQATKSPALNGDLSQCEPARIETTLMVVKQAGEAL